MRIGHGYDVHRFGDGDHIIIGGVHINHKRGLIAHSDGDFLLHALCDALLGAAALGDIGKHFPDVDPQYKDISSIKLLSKTCHFLAEKGFRIVNLDSTIFAEAPKIGPFRQEMQTRLAKTMNIKPDQVNVKATTTEGLGVIGKGEGIGALCIALIE